LTPPWQGDHPPRQVRRNEGQTGNIRWDLCGRVVELYALMHTMPYEVTGVPKKVPEIMEIRVAGGDVGQRFEYILGLLGKPVDLKNVIPSGIYADITAITTGKAPRSGQALGSEASQTEAFPWREETARGNPRALESPPRQVAGSSDGPDGVPAADRVQQAILKIGEDGAEVTPAGGFLHYGVLQNPYVLIKGSIPGPNKRLVRIRPAIRQGEHHARQPAIEFVSIQSKQG